MIDGFGGFADGRQRMMRAHVQAGLRWVTNGSARRGGALGIEQQTSRRAFTNGTAPGAVPLQRHGARPHRFARRAVATLFFAARRGLAPWWRATSGRGQLLGS